MSINILMPSLSPTMKEGTLSKWLIKVGDNVKAGDVLAEIETDKATMELEAVDEGVITDILIKEGAEGISINTPIAILNGSKDDKEIQIEDKVKDKQVSQESKKLKLKEKEILNASIKDKNYFSKKKNFADKKVLASPFAKKISKEKEIDLLNIIGSGPGGRIIKRDLENLNIEINQLQTTSKYETLEPSNMRKVIAKKTTETKNTVPHYYLSIESNVDKLLNLRKQINEQNLENNISINDLFVKALALAQLNNPDTNVYWHNNKIIQYSTVDVSVAVALKEGLITPIIKNADTKGLLEISVEIKELVNKAKNGTLQPEEYYGGTISISNLGMYGITQFSAIINPPQSSILAVGSIQKVLKLEKKEIKEVNIIKSTLSVDHRSIDGSIAANLLKDFNDIIENPFNIWLQSKDMKII